MNERKRANKDRARGINGIDEGYDPNMADVCNISCIARDMVQLESIARCWKRACCLTCAAEADITQPYCRNKSSSCGEDEIEILSMVKRLNLGAYESERAINDNALIEEWVDYENSEEGCFFLAAAW